MWEPVLSLYHTDFRAANQVVGLIGLSRVYRYLQSHLAMFKNKGENIFAKVDTDFRISTLENKETLTNSSASLHVVIHTSNP